MLEAVVSDQEVQVTYPSLGDRIQSTFIDTLLFVLLMFLFTSILDNFENAPDWIRIVLFSCMALYDPICASLGCTLGNYIKNIRVRRHNDTTKRINFFSAVNRFALKLFLGWLSFITIHFNKQRRAVHDLAAGSVVIKK